MFPSGQWRPQRWWFNTRDKDANVHIAIHQVRDKDGNVFSPGYTVRDKDANSFTVK